jgi:hypothetical protein
MAVRCSARFPRACYVAAFGLDAGECLLDIMNRFASVPAADATFTAALPAQAPGGPNSEVYILKERFPQVYAADLPGAAITLATGTMRTALHGG